MVSCINSVPGTKKDEIQNNFLSEIAREKDSRSFFCLAAVCLSRFSTVSFAVPWLLFGFPFFFRDLYKGRKPYP